jgi:hypothetical protein
VKDVDVLATQERTYRRKELMWKELWDEGQKLEPRAYPVA